VGAGRGDDRPARRLIVALISGRGSNLQALLDAGLPVSGVISNKADAGGLELAAARGISARVVDPRAFPSRSAFDDALGGEIDRFAPRLVVLAGFMRVLGARFVERYRERMLNIHPSLLPAFPGLQTHERALAAGVKVHGCTVHFVTAELDQGPIVIQAAVAVRPDDTPTSLAARVLRQEHVIYPRAVRWFLEQRLVVASGVVRVEGIDGQLVLAAD
jgi:phosphoribosylglycinamide formyltransferase 1